MQNRFDCIVFVYVSPKLYLLFPYYFYCRLIWNPFENSSLFYFSYWKESCSTWRLFLFGLSNFVGSWYVEILTSQLGDRATSCILLVRILFFRSIVLLSLIRIACEVTWFFLWLALIHQTFRCSGNSMRRHALSASVEPWFLPIQLQWISFLVSPLSYN